MNNILKYYSYLRTWIYSSWKLLLRNCKIPPQLGAKPLRSAFRGRIGLRCEYVIHSKSVPAHKEDGEESMASVLRNTEQRFQQGFFFQPISDQADLCSVVITGKIKQGEMQEQTDHLIAIYTID